MKKSKSILSVFFIISLIIQIVYFNNSDKFYKFGFAIGIERSIKQLDMGVDLVYVTLPVLFIIFLFSGSIHQITSGYGKLLIIRNYSKTRLYLKNYIKTFSSVVLLVIFETLFYILCNNMFHASDCDILKSVIMYCVVLNLIVSLQTFLELFIMPHIANIIVFIYCYISYFIAQIFTENEIIKILLFPCLLFGMQNSTSESNIIYYIFLCSTILLNLLLVIISIIRFKKTDIF